MSHCCCQGIAPDDARFHELDTLIETARTVPGSLITVLHRAQQLFGYLPEEVQLHIAKGLNLPPSEVYGVVTFYNFFNIEPVGRYPISVCMGTACYVRGGDRVLEQVKTELGIQPGEMTPDGLFSLEVCRCIGACGLAPVITVVGEVHGKMTASEAQRIIAKIRQQESGAEATAVGGEGQ